MKLPTYLPQNFVKYEMVPMMILASHPSITLVLSSKNSIHPILQYYKGTETFFLRNLFQMFDQLLNTGLRYICAYTLSAENNPTGLNKLKTKQTPWTESASELYRQSDHRLSAKLVPTFTDRYCVSSAADPYGRNPSFYTAAATFPFK
jgi:hypothetical protein